jgi:hypothetical protein
MLCACAYHLQKPDTKLRVHGATSHVFCRMRSLFKVERKKAFVWNQHSRRCTHMVCFECVVQLVEGEVVAAVPGGKEITVGSRFATVSFTTIHFYDLCRVGPSTADLRCITVANSSVLSLLSALLLFSGVHVFLLFLF